MKVIHNLHMDLARCGCRPVVAAVQGEANARVLEVALYNSGVAWEIPEAAVVDVAYQKPDGTQGIYSKLPDGSEATTYSGNVLSATLAPQMLTVPGTIRAAFVFHYEGQATLATFPFTITVEANPAAGAERSEDYYNPTVSDIEAEVRAIMVEIQGIGDAVGAAEAAAASAAESARTAAADAVAGAQQVVDSITPESIGARPATWTPTAADVGARPNTWTPSAADVGAAPAGYGLGEKCITVSSWDDATKSGFYHCEGWSGYVTAHAGGDISQECFGQMSGKMYKRFRWYCDGSWKEWEWVAPPMHPGVEYRTTERWQGKPVYKQVLAAGALPASGSTHLNIPTSGTIDYILSAKGSVSGQRVFPSSKVAGAMTIDLETHSGGVDVYVSHDFLGGALFYVTVEYTLV